MVHNLIVLRKHNSPNSLFLRIGELACLFFCVSGNIGFVGLLFWILDSDLANPKHIVNMV